jgi:hypothetical protein
MSELQALQGGIGGLPNTPFQPATLQRWHKAWAQ